MQPSHEIIIHPSKIPATITPHFPGEILTDFHWHEELEITAALDSNIEFTFQSHKVLLKENDVIIVNSGDIHRGMPLPNKAATAITLQIAPSFLKQHCTNFEQVRFSLDGKSDVRHEISDYMYELYYLSTDEPGKPYFEVKVTELVCHIIYLVLTQCQTLEQPSKYSSTVKYQQRYREIMNYITEHYTEPIQLSDIANFAHISKEHLSREFKKYVGEGFREHLTNVRISKSQSELTNTDIPLLDLALKHGFSDLRSYNRAFQKTFGMSPSQYRRNYRRNYSENNIG